MFLVLLIIVNVLFVNCLIFLFVYVYVTKMNKIHSRKKTQATVFLLFFYFMKYTTTGSQIQQFS